MKKFSVLLLTMLLFSCTSQLYEETNAPFDGVKFNNIEPFEDKSIFDLIKWKVEGMTESSPWPDDIVSKQFKPFSQRSVKPMRFATSMAWIQFPVAQPYPGRSRLSMKEN